MATQSAGNGRRPFYDIVIGVSIIVTAASIIWGVRTLSGLVTQMELVNNNYRHTIDEHQRYERTHDRYDRQLEQIDRRLTTVERDRQQSGERRSP